MLLYVLCVNYCCYSTLFYNRYIQELLHFHPGLDFLQQHEEFQRKYALTVITRIFYRTDRSRTGRISLRELRMSNLMTEFMHVDEETGNNPVLFIVLCLVSCYW